MNRKELRQKARTLASKYGYLEYMIERYLALWGENETVRFLEACEKPVKTAIRINTLKGDIETIVQRLEKKGVALEQIPWIPEGYRADFGNLSPGSLTEYMLGLYYIQGVPSMTVARVLNPQPDEIIMDLAAAPGGKTTHLAQLMKNKGLIIAVEQDRLRLNSLESNIYRCGVFNTLVFRGDARKIAKLEIVPDKILLDAPCSGEGLIPIDSTRKTSKTMADIRYCATKQNELLEAAIRILAPGGELVYSTCSLAPEENEFVIDSILKQHPEMKVVRIEMDFGVPGYVAPFGVQMEESIEFCRRFLPHRHNTEGFFICKMVKGE